MRKLIAVLGLAALAAACTDRLVEPAAPGVEVAAPSFAKVDGEPKEASQWMMNCGLWDASGAPWDEVLPCHYVFTSNPSGSFTATIFVEGIPNSTGRAAHFSSTAYPEWLADVYWDLFEVAPVDGKLPLCDYNLVQDPEMQTLICTTNWKYVISASGQGQLTMIGAPHFSFTKPCDRCWG
jgi:hypothetical protein